MNAEQRQKASRLRQDMNTMWTQMGGLLDELKKRESLVKGTLYERRRQCGRQGCRCGHGQLHVSLAFSYSEGGQTRHVSLRGIEPTRLERSVERYRRFRTARAELVKSWHALRELVEEMESVRRMEFGALADDSPHKSQGGERDG